MLEPYFNLDGEAEEAISFYDSIFHCKSKQIFRLGDMPQNPDYPLPEEMKNLIGDSEIDICGTTVHISDLKGDHMTRNGHISLLLPLDTPEEIERIYQGLSDSGKILMDLAPETFATLFAWVEDKFGVGWQLMYTEK